MSAMSGEGGMTDEQAAALLKNHCERYGEAGRDYKPALWLIEAVKEAARTPQPERARPLREWHSDHGAAPVIGLRPRAGADVSGSAREPFTLYVFDAAP